MDREYVKNKKNPAVIQRVADASLFVKTGAWVVATAAEYEAAQSGKKPKGDM